MTLTVPPAAAKEPFLLEMDGQSPGQPRAFGEFERRRSPRKA